MAKVPAKKSVQISSSVSPELFKALEDYRWKTGSENPEYRLEKTDVLRKAVEEFVVNHGIEVPETAAE